MRHEVTMPQLGMAQDSGKLVAWMKSIGDTVEADEALMEVETDKATMEVPAGRSGVLAEILADAGADVPVGDLIAVISDEASPAARAPEPGIDGTEQPSPAESKSAPPAAVARESAGKKDLTPVAAGAVPGVPKSGAGSGRILASPKAKRLASELGVDLRALLRRGVSEPIHALDVESASSAAVSIPSSFAAVAASDAFDELLKFLRNGGFSLSASLVWASFVAGALRAAGILEGDISVYCRDFGVDAREFVCRNADLVRLTAVEPSGAGPADIAVTNLTGTRFSSFASGRGDLPHLVVAARNEGVFCLSLQFEERDMPVEAAAEFLEELMKRVENPVRHLL
ncbi:MAG: hypothetical protein OXC26_01455 [Albidovulum sp.]|nr:hypothetical protein [Albidovulum sp.]